MAAAAPSAAPTRARRWSVTGVDVAVALAVLVVQLGAAYGVSVHGGHHDPWEPAAVVLTVAGPAALLVRRRFPVVSLAVALSAALAYWVVGFGRGPLFPALIVAFGTAVVSGRRAAALASLVVGYVGFLWLRPLLGWGSSPNVAGVVALAAWLLVLLGIGEAVRARRLRSAAMEQAREADASRLVSEERLRIARELHDVLAHNISLINVQAATTLHRAERSEQRAYDALATIKQVSQDTLIELRSVLGALRQVDEDAPRSPAPSLSRLDELLTSASAAGVRAKVEIRGTPRRLPASVDLAAYRIAQEALTNVARHAGTDAADVQIVYGEHDLVVQVEDRGTCTGVPVAGTGISGMRERAVALRGQLNAGPRPGGGFRVRAWLPVRSGE